ncbi:MAG: sterol desaturase family protein [Reichenbachiella sp.]|uniref:sterol desaturase family protein n=1 Tax=Reichenbachiella sp. TaxID=2184521 RepID=UPI00296679B5|nr:sterol desaturase family protein [Reichenbachiella sp.]MDW3210156.1 sterol desaturase family protein [Reichenbachiella sp.]
MDFQLTTEIWQRIVVIDFLRYFIFASGSYLLIWVILKKPLEHLIIQKKLPSLKRKLSEFAYSMSTVLVFSIFGTFIHYSKRNGGTQIYQDVAQHGWLWVIISIAIMILFHDFYFYWTHKWMHHKSIFKYVHKVHHQSTNPSPWAAYAFHPLEAVVQASVFPILIFSLPLHSIAIFSFLIYMITRNVMGHLGFELFPKKFVDSKWLNWHTTTTHHDMHHKHFNANYGLYFSWWDRWMGTEHEAYQKTYNEVKSRKTQDKPVKKAIVSTPSA